MPDKAHPPTYKGHCQHFEAELTVLGQNAAMRREISVFSTFGRSSLMA
jgi:hypothetical protein